MKKTTRKSKRTQNESVSPRPPVQAPRLEVASRTTARPTQSWGWIVGLLVLIIAVVGLVYALRNRTIADSPAAVATASAPTPPPAPAFAVGPADACRRHPRFAPSLGFSINAGLSTSSPDLKGMVLIEPATVTQTARFYQHPTWTMAGYLGHMVFDPAGNVYTFPAPRVSLIDNPPEQQNKIYHVNTDSGVMTTFITLTAAAPPSPENPFGVLGLAYDCDTTSLYATSVAGSTRAAETGKLARIDLSSARVITEATGIDAIGVTVYNTPTGKRLYFGRARSADVDSIALDGEGNFVGEAQYELSLPDPSYKAWRINFTPEGVMQIRGLQFDFNLIATGERDEVQYKFGLDAATGGWQLIE